MASKRPRRKTTRKPRKSTKKNQGLLAKYSVNIGGAVAAVLALLGLFHAGIVGVLIINLVRILVGSLYPLGLILIMIAGLWLAGFAKLPKIKLRYWLGTVLLVAGILIWLTLIEYVQTAQPVAFVSTNWAKLADDMASANTTSNIGGGILATCLFFMDYICFWGRLGLELLPR